MGKKLEVIAKFRRGSLVRDSKGQHFLRLPYKGLHPVTAKQDGLAWEIRDDKGAVVSSRWLFGGRV